MYETDTRDGMNVYVERYDRTVVLFIRLIVEVAALKMHVICPTENSKRKQND